MTVLLVIMLLLASLAFFMLLANLRLYRLAPAPGDEPVAVSLLIPARNEAGSIEACLAAALQSQAVELEVVVLDDHSSDGTGDIVRRVAAVDSRVRLESAPPLPAGWCGKQHACWTLAGHARHDVLMFIDADVRLAPDALARGAAFLLAGRAGLVSGFPRQICGSWLEQLVVPMIHLVLLCYLPIARMRQDGSPGLGAGCGQWMIARREAYEQAGGHQAIRESLHDGVRLPRAFRQAGWMTDLFDATDTARCRMYRNAREVWGGFAKNATEGMAGNIGIWVWTLLLAGGHVLPWLAVVVVWWPGCDRFGPGQKALATLAWLLAVATSVLLGVRFRQPLLAIVLRPAGVVCMLAIQWYARILAWIGRPVGWRGRRYP